MLTECYHISSDLDQDSNFNFEKLHCDYYTEHKFNEILLKKFFCLVTEFFLVPIFTVSLREFQFTYFLIGDREAQAS